MTWRTFLLPGCLARIVPPDVFLTLLNSTAVKAELDDRWRRASACHCYYTSLPAGVAGQYQQRRGFFSGCNVAIYGLQMTSLTARGVVAGVLVKKAGRTCGRTHTVLRAYHLRLGGAGTIWRHDTWNGCMEYGYSYSLAWRRSGTGVGMLAEPLPTLWQTMPLLALPYTFSRMKRNGRSSMAMANVVKESGIQWQWKKVRRKAAILSLSLSLKKNVRSSEAGVAVWLRRHARNILARFSLRRLYCIIFVDI